jgi:hypothetical protein
MCEKCLSKFVPLCKFSLSRYNCSFVMQGYCVDETAFDLAASDISGPIRIPMQTTTDGYYLPRCGSMFAFGNEKTKIRTRIIMKLALNEQLYLDNENLQRGTNLERQFLRSLEIMESSLSIHTRGTK